MLRNKELIEIRGDNTNVSTISNSQDFSNTSYNYVKNKVKSLELESRIEIFQLDISKSLDSVIEGRQFSLVLLDVDLYSAYVTALEDVWNHIAPGGIIYLDEYYSLKFPCPRKAVNKFLEVNVGAELVRLDDWRDFERWIIRKP